MSSDATLNNLKEMFVTSKLLNTGVTLRKHSYFSINGNANICITWGVRI